MRHRPVIAFVVPYPFEILDLTGPVSVFERAAASRESATTRSESCPRDRDGAVRTEGGMAIGDTCKYSDYVGPIDTLIVSGGVGAVCPAVTGTDEMVARARCSHSACRIYLYRSVPPRGCRLLDGCRVATHWQYCDLSRAAIRTHGGT